MADAEASFERLLSEAKSRVNIKLFNKLMSRCARFGELANARRTMAELRAVGLVPNEFTYSILLNAYTRAGGLEKLEGVMAEMKADGVAMNEARVALPFLLLS